MNRRRAARQAVLACLLALPAMQAAPARALDR
jgi:hypothetical protein